MLSLVAETASMNATLAVLVSDPGAPKCNVICWPMSPTCGLPTGASGWSHEKTLFSLSAAENDKSLRNLSPYLELRYFVVVEALPYTAAASSGHSLAPAGEGEQATSGSSS